MNVVELLDKQAEERGHQIAIRHGDQEISYQELVAQSGKGNAYLKSLGLKKKDVVLVFVPMSIDLYIILLALWRQGITALFLDPSSGRKRMDYCCARVSPKAFIGTPKSQILRLVTATLRKIPIAISTGRTLICKKWSTKGSFESDLTYVNCEEETPALITFTSGSTGLPKGTVRSHGFLFAQNKVLQKTLGLQPGNADLATLPIFALINLASGVTTIIPSVNLLVPGKINPLPVLNDVVKYRPQSAVASPAFFECLLEDKKRKELSCLHKLFTGGAPVFPGLLKRLQAQMPESAIVAVYGSTEAEPIAEIPLSQISAKDFVKMADGEGLLAGAVIDDIQCKIIRDLWGTPLKPMTQKQFYACQNSKKIAGEIVVHGEHVLKKYLDGFGDLENKFAVDGEIWHRTGDLGYFDETGRLWLLGRCAAKVHDEFGTLFPFAIETAAMQFEDVRRAALCLVDNNRVLVVETSSPQQKIKKKLSEVQEKFNIKHVLIQKIPVDKRHNAKVDYPALLKSIEVS
jgi:olefin beta-lactone synthetase